MFRSREAHRRTVPRYLAVLGAGFGLNAAVVALGVDLLGLPVAPVQVVATGLVLAWNFTAHRLWTFRASPRPAAPTTRLRPTSRRRPGAGCVSGTGLPTRSRQPALPCAPSSPCARAGSSRRLLGQEQAADPRDREQEDGEQDPDGARQEGVDAHRPAVAG